MRLRLDLAYDGTDFNGWAVQPGQRTVQLVVQDWIGTVLRNHELPSLIVAGRTDAGVHARGQVCHLDVPIDDPDLPAELQYRLSRVLPPDVVVRSVTAAPEGFNARFSAIWRRYCYRLVDGWATPDPLQRRFVTPVRDRLDVEALNAAAATLIGLRDFAAFCKPRPGATTIRELRELSAVRAPNGVIEIHLLADAFCRSMVRSLVGGLTIVASGRRNMAWLEDAAAHPKRHGDVRVMAARGLTLEEVGYPSDDGLAERAATARTTRFLEHHPTPQAAL